MNKLDLKGLRLERERRRSQAAVGLIEPNQADLEVYRRLGLKEYVSPSGKRYPLTQPFQQKRVGALDAIGAPPLFDESERAKKFNLEGLRAARKKKKQVEMDAIYTLTMPPEATETRIVGETAYPGVKPDMLAAAKKVMGTDISATEWPPLPGEEKYLPQTVRIPGRDVGAGGMVKPVIPEAEATLPKALGGVIQQPMKGIEQLGIPEIFKSIREMIVPTTPYTQEESDRMASELGQRIVWMGKYIPTLGGRLGGKNFRKRLLEEAESFAGFGPAIAPAAGEMGTLALEWGIIYPALFRAIGMTGSAISKIPRVAKAAEAMKKMGGLERVAGKFPRAYARSVKIAKAIGKGAGVGGVMAGAEVIGKEMEFGEVLQTIGKRAALMAGVSGTFQAVSEIDTALYTKRLRNALITSSNREFSRLLAKVEAMPKTAAQSAAHKSLMSLKRAELQAIDKIVSSAEAQLLGIKKGKLYQLGQETVENPQRAADRLMRYGLEKVGEIPAGVEALKKGLGKTEPFIKMPMTRTAEAIETSREIGQMLKHPARIARAITERVKIPEPPAKVTPIAPVTPTEPRTIPEKQITPTAEVEPQPPTKIKTIEEIEIEGQKKPDVLVEMPIEKPSRTIVPAKGKKKTVIDVSDKENIITFTDFGNGIAAKGKTLYHLATQQAMTTFESVQAARRAVTTLAEETAINWKDKNWDKLRDEFNDWLKEKGLYGKPDEITAYLTGKGKELDVEDYIKSFSGTALKKMDYNLDRAVKTIAGRIKGFAKTVPEFTLNPTFTFDKESGQLVFKDRYRFGFYPAYLGFEAEDLKDGQTIRFDLSSFGIKPATKAALKKAEAFIGEPKILGRTTKEPIPIERVGKIEPRKKSEDEEIFEQALTDIETGKRVEVPGGAIYTAVTEDDIRRVAELGRKAGRQGWTVEREILLKQEKGTAESKVAFGDTIRIVRDVFSAKPPVEVEEIKPTKEPAKAEIPIWQLTRDEYEALPDFQRIYGKTEGKNREAALSVHKVAVEDALAEGKPVPRHVLEEYKSEPWAREALVAKPAVPAVEKQLLEKYDNNEIDIGDLIDELEETSSDEEIQNAIAEYREAQKADRLKYGMRSGLPEELEEKIETLLRKKTEPAPKAEPTKLKETDYIQFQTEGGMKVYGSISMIFDDGTISVLPDGMTNPIPIKPQQVIGIEQRGGRKYKGKFVTTEAPKVEPAKTTIQTSIGTIEIPKSELNVKWDKALEVIFDYGNQTAAGKPLQPGLERSLSKGDTVEYEGKTWLVMPQGWQDVSQLSQEQIDKIVGEAKIPLPPKAKKPARAELKEPQQLYDELVAKYGEAAVTKAQDFLSDENETYQEIEGKFFDLDSEGKGSTEEAKALERQMLKMTDDYLSAKPPTTEEPSEFIPEVAEPKHIKNVVVETFRQWPKGIKKVGKDYWIEVMATAKQLVTPYRYKALRRTMLGVFRYMKKTVPPKVIGIELQDVTDALTATHELGHNIDWLLNNRIFPSSIKGRFPDTKVGEMALRKELKKVSQVLRRDMWEKPKAYIKKHTELMADFISHYILDPEKTRELAPNVTRAFEAKLAGKPELFDIISRLQESRYTGPEEPPIAEHIREVFPLPKEFKPLQLAVDMTKESFVKAAEDLGITAVRQYKVLIQRAQREADRIDKLIPDKERQTDLVVVAENGTANPWTGKTLQEIKKEGLSDAEIRAIKLFRAYQEKARQTVNKYLRGADIAEYIKFIEDYFIHAYHTPLTEKYKSAIARWAKRSPQAKKRILPDLAKAVELGLKPRAKTLSEGLMLWCGINARVATNKAFLRILPQITNDDGVSILQKPQDYPSWPTVDYWPIRQNYAKPLPNRGILLFQGRVAVDPRVKPFIDAMFGRKSFHPVVRVIEGLNATWKAFELTLFSLFHHQAEFFSACGALGRRAIPFVGGYYGKRAQVFGKRPKLWGILPAHITTLKAGKQLEQCDEFMEDYLAHGGQRGYISTEGINLMERSLKRAADYLENIIQYRPTTPLTGVYAAAYVPVKTAQGIYHFHQKLLWDNVNRAKLITYYQIVADGAKHSDLPIKEVKEIAVKYINDNYGGQEWLNTMFRNPKIRQFFTQTLMSHDWTWSQIKTAKWPFGIGEKGKARRAFVRNTGIKHWWRYLFAIGACTFAGSWALSGKPPWENEKGHTFDIDWTNLYRHLPWNRDWKARGDYARRYFALGKAGRELVRWVTSPLLAFGYKLSPFARSMFEQTTGYNIGSSWAEPWAREDLELHQEIYARFKHLLENFEPFAFSGNNAFLAFPSRKGMTQWKAVKAYEKIYDAKARKAAGGLIDSVTKIIQIIAKDENKLRAEIERACRLNGVDSEKADRVALSGVRSKYYHRFWDSTKKPEKTAIKKCNAYARALLSLGVRPVGFKQSLRYRIEELPERAKEIGIERFIETATTEDIEALREGRRPTQQPIRLDVSGLRRAREKRKGVFGAMKPEQEMQLVGAK